MNDLRWLKTIIVFFSLFVLLSSGCAIPSSPYNAGSNRAPSEIERNITDLEYKMAELTREMAELDGRVKKLEAVSSGGIGGAVKEPVKEEKISPANVTGDTSKITPEPDGSGKTESPGAGTSEAGNPRELYDSALARLMNRDTNAALPLFIDFVSKYPDHDLTDNAYYWIGECYYSQKNYGAAIENFNVVVTKFAKRDKVPDALLKVGYSYAEMGNSARSQEILDGLIRDYPESPAADLARQKLLDLK